MATIPRSIIHAARPDSIPLPEQVTIALGELRETAREGLLALSVGLGLAVVGEISRRRSRRWPDPVASTTPAGRLIATGVKAGS